ncbi:hypothetical protein, variant 2 [Aphanomyces astaci]|uniref:EF-hand domain-containing protein n=1 Tax=Aphanomyces astaci TaxID=112090 RepID=W4GKF0_APHAT|nr:hypothetical protein, variant 1 [Aphanomyces astaci]XP_009830056.1 hypothetical protein, variant 2 [Aphanomyces astaci]ETV80131.1 hypothetical protein, variant 1 [Aphanomyces astaci]ETV80132.1 hypothetical protein, variant 2 [Aphanomyces astaci]|eukprot:XP_009830055.1 hypothetical protein, variant 1 [Aphanomyces astaci]
MSSKRSKKDGETKTEGDGDKKKSKSKKKEKAPSKEPKEPKEPKEKAPVVEPPTTTQAPPPPVIEQPEINDPDAIQLFRRYDREKANHVTRSDFLDLLRDYTTWYPGRKWNMPVMPCALTDAAGVPLGFERTSRNSEFEAGQLFERYDTNRSGTLELGEFQLFFRDFKKQLAPFVDEMLAAFHATPPLSRMGFDSAGLPRRHPPTNSFGEPTTTNPWQQRPPNHDSSQRVFDTRHLYESKLDQLHALSEKTLRHLQLQKLDHGQYPRHQAATATLPTWTRHAPPPSMMPHHHHNTSAPRWHDMDELERDLAFVDRIYTDTTKFMEQAHRVVSIEDMNAFLDEFPRVEDTNKMKSCTTYECLLVLARCTGWSNK